MSLYRQPIKKNNRFYNHDQEALESLLFKTGISCIQSLGNRKKRVPTNLTDLWQTACPLVCSVVPTITWIGHATFLIQVGNINIVTDPIFGGASFLYPRILPPGIPFGQLPPIDVVLISHNHRDHMDEATLLQLKLQNPNLQLLVPFGDKRWFDQRNFMRVTEHHWWQAYEYEPKNSQSPARFVFLPAVHWSQRGLFDKNRSLWGSWMIEACGYRIYFAGDSAYAGHFQVIKQEFDAIHAALMPIAPGEPAIRMRQTHMDALQAGQAFLDLNAHQFIPMHWGTFLFGTDHLLTPLTQLQTWWQHNNALLESKRLHTIKIGQQIKVE